MAGTDTGAGPFSGEASALTDETVVDADVHITYNEEVRRQVAKYMDRPYRGYTDPDTSSDGYPSHGWPKALGGNRSGLNLMDVTDPQDVTEPLCDGLGVDHPIVNVASPVDKLLKKDRALEEMRAINDFLLDHFLDEADELYGLATIAGRDPAAAAAEVERLGDEDSIVGVYLTIGEEFNKPYGHPDYDVLHRALEDNDLTPVYHITGLHRKAAILRELDNVAAWHATGPAWAGQVTLTSLLFGGVAEKFPDLEFVLLEGGLGWLPGFIARLNREYSQWRSELPLLEQTPAEYVRDSFYFGTQPLPEFENPDHMRHTLEMVGADSLLFTTDHPHYDFDHPQALDRFLRHFPAEERRAILSGNATKVFGL